MAEGGGDVDDIVHLDHGSDDYHSLICAPCNDDGNHQIAAKFCSQCSEYLCTVCARYHRRLPGTDNHQLSDVNGDNSDGKKSAPSSKGPNQKKSSEKCIHHPDRDIELYCQSHDMVFCSLCIAMEHRSCEGISTLTKDTISEISRRSKPKSAVHEDNNLLESLNEMVNKVQYNIEVVDSQQTNILEELEEIETHLVRQIGDMKQQVVTELSEIHSKLKYDMAAKLTELRVLIKRLEQNTRKVKECSTTDTVRQFVLSKLSQDTMKCAEQLHRNIAEAGGQSLEFHPTNDLTNVIRTPLGQICINTDRREIDLTVAKIQSVQEINAKTADDTYSNYLIDICQLANGTIIIADNINETLKRLDNNFKVCETFKLAGGPLSICPAFDHTIASKLNTCKIQIVRIADRMSSIRTFGISKTRLHWGMVYDDDKLWVLEDKHLCTYDESGLKLSSYILDETFSKTQRFHMTLNKARTMLLIANGDCGITCLGKDGQIIKTMTDSRLSISRGICTTGYGTVLVTGYSSNNIVMFNEAGECLGELELPENKRLQYAISILHDDTRHRILVSSELGKLYVLQF